jgi:hypothetical protein
LEGVADAGYGPQCTTGLTTRGLARAVGIPRHLKVYPISVKLWPVATRGRPRKRYIPDIHRLAQTIARVQRAVIWQVPVPYPRTT